MINLQKLSEISELNIAGKLEDMDKNTLKDYTQTLSSLVDNFSDLQVKIKTALETKEYKALKKHLTTVHDILEKCYADKMAQECSEQIVGFGNINHDKLAAFVNAFLESLSVLTIEIKMTQQEDIVANTMEALEAQALAASVPEKKILAVDDTPFFLSILQKIFQDTKYKLTCVEDGFEALKYLEKNTPDLFLLDIKMPGMDGYELAEKIREKGFKAPIIFITSIALKENVAKALKVGAADFITKPINKTSLLSKIDKHMYVEN